MMEFYLFHNVILIANWYLKKYEKTRPSLPVAMLSSDSSFSFYPIFDSYEGLKNCYYENAYLLVSIP